MLDVVLRTLWFIFPAYAANAFPVVLKGTRPLDFGRTLRMQRILGDGKTIEGTFGGIAFGIAAGMLQLYLQQAGIVPVVLTVQLVVLLSVGAILGDIAGAFIKRRLGMPRGHSFFPLDQLDFVAGALVLSSTVYQFDIWTIAVLLLVTPPIHYGTNVIGYILRFKRTPW
ncbi:MAG: CDP-2,3-bis-(O-geranylgeranyl)-sn-glycerol synthase [Candidatus Aenigmarchaeota archaeon]|nr:CDP-2,3-bis-(O-geranylgeranyl)-sn-glycerol synthase [Candidatus Aenigmarchaeota archaeon]